MTYIGHTLKYTVSCGILQIPLPNYVHIFDELSSTLYGNSCLLRYKD